MEPPESSHGVGKSRGSVIIVDDDADLLEALKFGLELEGFEVQCHASSGAALTETLPTSGACVIIDYRLPDFDGLQLLRRLRAKGVELPAIIVTSHPKAGLLLRAATLGATIIEKPLLGDAFTVAIENAVSRSIGSAA